MSLVLTHLIGFGAKRPSASGSACVWGTSGNPSGFTVTNGGLTTSGSISFWACATPSSNITSGKYYYECQWSAFGSIPRIGWGNTGYGSRTSLELGDSGTEAAGWQPVSGQVKHSGASTPIQTGATGNRLCVAYDYGNDKIWYRTNNGNWNNSGSDDPATNTGGISLNIASSGGVAAPTVQHYGGGSCDWYFSSAGWSYSAPSAFSEVP